MEKRLKVLFMSGWYGLKMDTSAVFIREHAKAASLYNDITILYAVADPFPQPKGLCRIIEAEKDGIRTWEVRYGGIILYIFRRLAGRNRQGVDSTLSETTPSITSFPQRMVGKTLYYWGLFTGFRRLAKGGWKPDIIHTHVSDTSLPAILLGKLYGIPVIVTEHWSGFPKKTLTRTQRTIVRYVMKKAKAILPVSQFLKKSIEEYGITGEFRIVPNTINMDIFCPSPNSPQSDNARKQMLMVANLIPQKGIPDLLDALSRIKEKRTDFVLNIVGPEMKPYDYEEVATRLGLGKMVNFHKGFRTSEEVSEWMRNCDFFIQPSLWETFGVVYIEAMACGKPVIGTDLPALREIVNKDRGLLVPPRNVKALEEAIENMLDNYQCYSRDKIAQYVRMKFNYETIGKMLDQIYRDILRGMTNASALNSLPYFRLYAGAG